ncbi:MAG: hypothetical protein EBU30_04450 [Synechococcaceae bacterium WB6_3B_236]|nr:hypothetical protein [Synechococcaceae bacterium WB6_3B_236]
MAQQGTVPPDPQSSDPYEQLGISPEASFEMVQQAKHDRLASLPGDDLKGRARIEAAYDSVLMQRLKERQLGQLTGAAATASKREALGQFKLPRLALAEGNKLWIPLGGSALLLAGLLLAGGQPGTAELLLALATLLTVLCLQRRNGRFFPAVGYGFTSLALGLLLGSLLAPALGPLGLALAPAALAAIPALVLLALTALFVDS